MGDEHPGFIRAERHVHDHAGALVAEPHRAIGRGLPGDEVHPAVAELDAEGAGSGAHAARLHGEVGAGVRVEVVGPRADLVILVLLERDHVLPRYPHDLPPGRCR
ncbi:hypothetical protein LZ318_01085 [Saccharopolyspora indica]|uniref:hypothetical protein n=1 Tax=Saccharopolyspora indica TaxID=1229659 RepID=UPI0022EAFD50|nr:hypothetical protein [Saccharopolyspora indica]MDA3645625.1 hypothetical protein [Saccharopolyspora indica]